MSLGLALSGGGTKGASHIGVLQAIEEKCIKIDYLSGCSSGSIVAVLYACGYKPNEILDYFNKYSKYLVDINKMAPLKIIGSIFTKRIKMKGIIKGKRLEKFIRFLCLQKGIRDISEIKVPVAIPTVDINTGELVYYLSKKIDDRTLMKKDLEKINISQKIVYKYSGDIAEIVRASSSVPTRFEPKLLHGRVLVDGCVRSNTPVQILKDMGASKIIASTFEDDNILIRKKINIISIVLRTFAIMGNEINKQEEALADIVIKPNIKNVALIDSKQITLCAKLGYEEYKKIGNWNIM